uniref:Uncharacterized protein n=1 Tax=Arundo donax TaxID=35708 RepID=A0A0A8YMK5_ARUDO
MYKSMGNSNV